ncbi:hypothetical protein GGF49_000784 [Coemansia sp. RSA 1853]|nr:hypothetical protein GGF49_000784 [Coemansia sp. RSA 1853]
MFFIKTKTAIKATVKRIFRRGDNNSNHSGSATVGVIKTVAKRVFRCSHINRDSSNRTSNRDNCGASDGNSDSSTMAVSDGNSGSNCASDHDSDNGSNCASASNTAVSTSISTNSNSGSMAISGSNVSDSASKAVAALFEACAAKIAPKQPSVSKLAFERAPAHQPHRRFKGTPRPTMSLRELIQARKMGPLQGSRKDRLLANNAAHELIAEPKQTFAPRRAIEQAPAHQPCRCFKGSLRPIVSLQKLIRARMDQMSTKNELHCYIIEPKQTCAPKWAIEQVLPFEAAQTSFQHFTMPVTPYF